MASIFPDLRYSLRQIAKTPVASSIAVLSLALGIGANTAIFSIMNALILRTLPVRNPQQLVALHTLLPTEPEGAGIQDPVPWRAFEEIRKQNTVFSDMFAWGDGGLRNIEAGGVLYPGSAIEVSGEYFSALGVRPLLGRLLTPQDAVPGAPARVAVLDYRCWKNHFQSDPAVIGKTIRVDNVPLTVVGVTPEAFQNLNVDMAVDAAVPIGFQSANMSRRMAMVMGRLKDGATVEQARAQMVTMWPSILQVAIPAGFNAAQTRRFLSRRLYVERASNGFSFLRERMERPLIILICLAGAVLLIACANLGLLMAARAARRRNEIGIRIALGAGRWRLARQLLVECLTLSVAGAALAFVVSGRTGRLLVNMEWNGLVPAGLDVSP
ncbi:MAG TPA: ABC transporter permease, partial [Bryobacteraceae bacterium]|nr:ABC transporter permease [Bryobacteraceae bacterium]